MATNPAEKMQPKQGWQAFRGEVFDIIDNEETSDWRSQLFDSMIMILILLSLIATVAESFEVVKQNYGWHFDIFEDITLVIFVSEYLLRLWTADFKYKDESSYWKACGRFGSSGTGIIDLLAVFPLVVQFFVPYIVDIDLRMIRILKVTRMLRVLKLSSFTSSVIVVGDVFFEKRFELGITMFTTFIVMLVASTLMYYLEHDAQPDKFSNIVSTMWWAVATLTTVGYGDIYPITGWGQFAGSIIAILGLGVVALPTGIIGAAFIEKIEKQQEEERIAREEREKLALELEEAEEDAELAALTKNDNYNHELCSGLFGREFVYCPYCAKPLGGEHHHHHHANA
jgi:voltage-gated potassium channel